MAIDIDSGLSVNSVIWIQSLAGEFEYDSSDIIIKDLSAYLEGIGVPFYLFHADTANDLRNILDEIANIAQSYNVKPIIHFDMHGNNDGVLIARTGETVPWSDLASRLRVINEEIFHNLCVVWAVCYSFYFVNCIEFTKPCPVFLLIAPEGEESFGFFENNTSAFYKTLFTKCNITEAYDAHLKNNLKLFHSEQFFTVALSRFVKNLCSIEGKRRRVERLVEDVRSRRPGLSPEQVRVLEISAEHHLTPTQVLLDKYGMIFLHGRPCPITIDQMNDLIEGALA